jgi:hypothetical protein
LPIDEGKATGKTGRSGKNKKKGGISQFVVDKE